MRSVCWHLSLSHHGLQPKCPAFTEEDRSTWHRQMFQRSQRRPPRPDPIHMSSRNFNIVNHTVWDGCGMISSCSEQAPWTFRFRRRSGIACPAERLLAPRECFGSVFVWKGLVNTETVFQEANSQDCGLVSLGRSHPFWCSSWWCHLNCWPRLCRPLTASCRPPAFNHFVGIQAAEHHFLLLEWLSSEQNARKKSFLSTELSPLQFAFRGNIQVRKVHSIETDAIFKFI